jgi:GGDEF domain-containing protein
MNELLHTWRGELSALNAKDDDIYCSVSAGAAFGDGDYRASEILKLADERMYTEKAKSKKSRIDA